MFEKIQKQKSIYEALIVLGWSQLFIGFIIFLALAYDDKGGLGLLFLTLFVTLTIILVLTFTKKIKKLSNEFKQKYVYEELKKIFPNSTYEFDQGFSQDEVTDSGLLQYHTKYKSEDMITGKFEDVSFRCSDILQQEIHSAGKAVIIVTSFQGRYYEFSFPKEFKHNLLIIQHGQFRPFSEYKKLKLESIEFNSELKIYAKDEHEAFYILTPHFMEKLLYLDKKYSSKIGFSFLNNRLYLAINSGEDSFDIKPFTDIGEYMFDEIREELVEIKELIELLKLNNTLFKK